MRIRDTGELRNYTVPQVFRRSHPSCWWARKLTDRSNIGSVRCMGFDTWEQAIRWVLE